MGGMSQWSGELRDIPDQALQQELQKPSGLVPGFLVLAEAQRRATMRQAAQSQQQQGQASSTVLQDVVRNMMASQPPSGPAPAGMTPPRQGQAPMPGGTPGQMKTPAPPQQGMAPPGMAEGGPLHFDDGGDTNDIPTDDTGFADVPTAFDLNEAVSDTARRHHLDPANLWGVVQTESRGNPNALGPRTRYGRAEGLMQLIPSTAHQYGLQDWRNPQQNLEAGASYLEDLQRKYNNDWDRTRAAYNAGPGNVDKYGGVPPFKETRDYLKRSDRFAQEYAGADPTVIGPPAPPPVVGPPSIAEQQPADYPTNTQPVQLPGPPQVEDATQAAPTAAPTSQADRAAPPAQDQAAPPEAASNDPWSPANIERTRHMLDAVYGDEGGRQQLAQMRANTVKQLQSVQQEVLNRYHNPSPWSFLSNLAAGMSASHSLNLADAFGAGVGLASQRRDEEQEKALQDYQSLQGRIDGIQNTGESEAERRAGQMVTLLSRPPQGMSEFTAILGKTGVQYGQKNNPPGPGYVFKEDPTQPGWGAWIPTGQALKGEGKPEGREAQVWEQATGTIGGLYGLDPKLSYKSWPSSVTLKAPVTLPFDLPQNDGSVIKKGTVIPAGTTVNPARDAQTLADQSKVDLAAMTKQGKVAPLDDQTLNWYVQQLKADPANINIVPIEYKGQVGKAAATAGVNLHRLDAAERALQAPQDPKEVAYWADQSQADAKNFGMLGSNKGLQEAVRKELANRGVNVGQLDATIRQTAQFAQSVQPHIGTIFQELDKIDPNKLGPIFGRWNDFLTGKVGKGDPQYTLLRNNINLLDSALARIHGGARGGSSPPMIEYMHSMLSAGFKDAPTMRAALSGFKEWVDGYAKMAPKAGELSPSTPQPARPAGIPSDATAQYNAATRQWRYKPKGNDQWTILPQ